MNKIIILLFFTGLSIRGLTAQDKLASVFNADSVADEDHVFRKRPSIAVLPFYDANAQAKEVEFGRTVSSMLSTAFRSNTNFDVLERNELSQVVTAQASGISGLSSDEIRSFSTVYDVDLILNGDVSLINETLHIDARLIETSSSKIVVALYSTCQNLKNIREVVDNLAEQLEQSYLRQWMGSISINSSPSGAEVYLDGKYIGNTVEDTPLQIGNMLEGRYQLKFIRGGYYDWEGEIAVLAKMDRSVNVSLTAKPGSMNIYSDPDGAEIYVDNNFMGVTPLSFKKVAEGEHEIRLYKKNFREWTQRVLVRSFQPTDVKATLEVSPGILTVNSFPAGASILFKGKLIARTPHTMSNIPPGEIVLQIEKPGFESWTTSVQIAPNSQETLDVTLAEKKGTFTVSSKPDSALVYLFKPGDSQKRFIGFAPVTNFPLSIGNYIIEVEKDNYFSNQQEISIEYNQLSNVDLELQEKPGSVMISTYPQNVRIYLDGQFKGRSPLRLSAIQKGEYNVRMILPFGESEKTISVRSNQETKIDQRFRKSKDYIIPLTAIGAIMLTLQLLTN